MAARIQLLVGERQPREGKNAVIACNDFLRLGPGRSLRNLAQEYRKREQGQAPTRAEGTLFKWSAKFEWVARAESYDAQLEAEKNAAEQERRQQILNSGFALDYERVLALKDVADYLLGQVREEVTVTPERPEFAEWQTLTGAQNNGGQNAAPAAIRPNVWVHDVKQIGSGDTAERVDIVRFNAALIEQLRGALDDIAKETGGRVQRQEVNGKGVIETKSSVTIDLSSLTIEQLTALAQSLKD